MTQYMKVIVILEYFKNMFIKKITVYIIIFNDFVAFDSVTYTITLWYFDID